MPIGYTPKAGYERNPLKRHPNERCPCGSTKKVKKCHGRAVYVTAADAAESRKWLRAMGAVGRIEVKPGEIS